jgi:hypothetical protein
MSAGGKHFTEADGRELACNLLHDLRASAAAAEPGDDGRVDLAALTEAAADTLRRYLERARTDSALEAGFLRVLGDILAIVSDGCAPCLDRYEADYD